MARYEHLPIYKKAMDLAIHVEIYHDCTENYVYRGPPGAYARVPAHKTLAGVPKNKGLPIGNLNSQFFANVYLDGFDQFVKHTLKCQHYIRYCDDSYCCRMIRNNCANRANA